MVSFGVEFLAAEPANKLADVVSLSEKAGLEYAWITDHYNNRDSFSLLTYIAAKTDTIKLGTGVTNPYTRTAIQLASAIATVQETSNGRAVFGIGPGDKVTFDSVGIQWDRPLARVKETVEIVKALLAGEKVTYQGEVYNIKSAKLGFKPDPVPVYIGAQGPKMLELAGEYGDGALINASHPLDFKAAIPLLKKKARGDFSGYDVGAYTSFSMAERKEDALKAAKPVVAFIVAGSPDSVFERHDIAIEDVSAVRDGFKSGFSKAISCVTEQMVDAFSICGTHQECQDRIEELVSAGVTQVIMGSPMGPDRTAAIRMIGEKIIPHWRE